MRRVLKGCAIVLAVLMALTAAATAVAAVVFDAVVDAAVTELLRDEVRKAGLDTTLQFRSADFRWVWPRVVVEEITLLNPLTGQQTGSAASAMCTVPWVIDGALMSFECAVEHASLDLGNGRSTAGEGAFSWNVSILGNALGTFSARWDEVGEVAGRFEATGVTLPLMKALTERGDAPAHEIVRLAPDLALREVSVTAVDLGGRERILHILMGMEASDPRPAGPLVAATARGAFAAAGEVAADSAQAVERWTTQGGALRIGTHIPDEVRFDAVAARVAQDDPLVIVWLWQALGVGATCTP